MRRRFEYKHRELEDFLIRFYPAGNYTWVVPGGCTEVDVFLVGGGGGADRNRDGGMGGESDYDEGCGIGRGNRKSGGYGGGGCGSEGTGGDGTVLIRGKKYKS